MPSQSKKLAVPLVLGILALLVAGLALKRSGVERWYLWRLESENEAARLVAAEQLGKMKSVRAVSPLVKWIVQMSGAGLWIDVGSGMFPHENPTLPRDWRVDEARQDLLEELGAARGPAAPVLTERLGEIRNAGETLKTVRTALAGIGAEAVRELNRLASKTGGEKITQLVARLELLRILQQAKVRQDVSFLANVASDERLLSEFRDYSIIALGALRSQAKSAVPFLVTATRAETPETRMFAAYALGRIGPDARQSIPALEARLAPEEVHYVRNTAALALERIQNPD